ncbi:MAG: hypothetical protein U0V18_08835 [Anaerolineales bacterium]
MKNKTILVIGGTGMLGKPVAQQLKYEALRKMGRRRLSQRSQSAAGRAKNDIERLVRTQ